MKKNHINILPVNDQMTPLHLENFEGNTKNGELIITLKKGTGKYKIDIIPI